MSNAIVCATCGRSYATPALFEGPGHRGMCEKPDATVKLITFDVVQESGEGNEIARERLTAVDDQDEIDNAISEQLEGWILSIGDVIRIVEVEKDAVTTGPHKFKPSRLFADCCEICGDNESSHD